MKKLNSVLDYEHLTARKGEPRYYVASTDESPLAHFRHDLSTAKSRKRHGVIDKYRPLLRTMAEDPNPKNWKISVIAETWDQQEAEQIEEDNIRNYRGSGIDLVESDLGFNQTYNTKRASPATRKKIGNGNKNRRKNK